MKMSVPVEFRGIRWFTISVLAVLCMTIVPDVAVDRPPIQDSPVHLFHWNVQWSR